MLIHPSMVPYCLVYPGTNLYWEKPIFIMGRSQEDRIISPPYDIFRILLSSSRIQFSWSTNPLSSTITGSSIEKSFCINLKEERERNLIKYCKEGYPDFEPTWLEERNYTELKPARFTYSLMFKLETGHPEIELSFIDLE